MELLIDEMLDGKILLGEAVAEFEKLYIERAVARYGSRVTTTACALGIHRNTLSKHLAGDGHKPAPKKIRSKRVKKVAAKVPPRKTKAAAASR
jgi:DNA-binding NtrC family response regulator